MERIEELREKIKRSNNIVFLGGAGVSTASGIPDFRSTTGLYNRNHQSTFSPEYMLSYTFFKENPKEFMTYVEENLIYENILPNKAHIGLAKLEKMGKLKMIITQNIDSLHQMAGSKSVIEIHGSLRDFYCTKCGEYYSLNKMKERKYNIECDKCENIIRPDVVLYGERLKEKNINNAIKYIENAEILIVGGTSLKVHPAAGLIQYYKGKELVLINKDKTDFDSIANYIFNSDIEEIITYLSDI